MGRRLIIWAASPIAVHFTVMLLDRVLTGIVPKTPIPNPDGPPTYRFRGRGTSRNRPAVAYLIPNRHNPEKPNAKLIADFEWEMVDAQLKRTQTFTREWFKQMMPDRAETDPCNFRAIGGMLQLLGIVVPDGRDAYRLV